MTCPLRLVHPRWGGAGREWGTWWRVDGTCRSGSSPCCGGWGGVGAGAVGGGGFVGRWGWQGQTFWCWRRELRWRPGRLGSGGPGGWRAGDARPAAAAAGRIPGGSGRRGPSGLDTTAGGYHTDTGVLADPGVWGLPGGGPAPALASATAPVCRTRGGAWGRELWGRHTGLGPVTATDSVSLPRRWPRAERPATSRRGRIWPQEEPQGAAHPAQGEAACGRPAALASGRAPPTVVHVWAHRVRLAGRTHQRTALAAADRRGRGTPGKAPSDQDGPTHPRADSYAPAASQRLSGCPPVFPRTHARTTHLEVHQPGRAFSASSVSGRSPSRHRS